MLLRIARRLRKTRKDLGEMYDMFPNGLAVIKAGLMAAIEHEKNLRSVAKKLRKKAGHVDNP